MKARVFLRYGHILIAGLIAAYIYSPTLKENPEYEMLIRFGVFPVVALMGIAMWQQGRISSWLRAKCG